MHGLARAAGARPRLALAVAAAAAVAWSVVGPLVDSGAPYPFAGNALGLMSWLVLVAAIGAAPFLARADPVARRVHVALVLWLAPTALVWAWTRPDEVRHLAPVWPAFVLLATAALVSVSFALARLRPAAFVVPALAVLLLAVANVPSIDGLGRSGWRGLLDLGWSGWTSPAEVENYAWGPFSYVVSLARENVGDSEQVVTSDGRLSYFFPGRVDVRYARTCGELEGARFFSFLTAGESRVLGQQEGQPLDPLGWEQCTRPRLRMVGEQPGIYAAFVVGAPPARAPTPTDCHISAAPGQLLDAVFGEGLTYAAARALVSPRAGGRIRRSPDRADELLDVPGRRNGHPGRREGAGRLPRRDGPGRVPRLVRACDALPGSRDGHRRRSSVISARGPRRTRAASRRWRSPTRTTPGRGLAQQPRVGF